MIIFVVIEVTLFLIAFSTVKENVKPANEKPLQALSGILFNYAWAPLVAAAISIVLLVFYKLDKQYPQIMIELKERRAA